MFMNILIGTAAILLLFTIILFWRSGHFWRTLTFSALTGNAALATVVYMGAFTGPMLALNPFTVTFSALLGIPGVVTLLICRLLLGL